MIDTSFSDTMERSSGCSSLITTSAGGCCSCGLRSSCWFSSASLANPARMLSCLLSRAMGSKPLGVGTAGESAGEAGPLRRFQPEEEYMGMEEGPMGLAGMVVEYCPFRRRATGKSSTLGGRLLCETVCIGYREAVGGRGGPGRRSYLSKLPTG